MGYTISKTLEAISVDNAQNKKLLKEFYTILKTNPILKNKLVFYNGVKNNTIVNESLALEYVEKMLETFEGFPTKDLTLSESIIDTFSEQITNLTENYEDTIGESIDFLVESKFNGVSDPLRWVKSKENLVKELTRNKETEEDLTENVNIFKLEYELSKLSDIERRALVVLRENDADEVNKFSKFLIETLTEEVNTMDETDDISLLKTKLNGYAKNGVNKSEILQMTELLSSIEK